MPNDYSFKGPFDPAFPAQTRNGHEDFNRPVWGLTKREYMATSIIQAMIVKGTPFTYEDAVTHADSLLKALNP